MNVIHLGMHFERFRGACSGLPKAGEKRFRISLAVFLPQGAADDLSMKAAIEQADPEFMPLLRASNLPEHSITVFVGDPEEDLEASLDEQAAALAAHGLCSVGYLVLSRNAKLGPEDNLPQSPEEWDRLVPPLERTPELEALFEHLRTHYVQPQAPRP